MVTRQWCNCEVACSNPVGRYLAVACGAAKSNLEIKMAGNCDEFHMPSIESFLSGVACYRFS